MNINRKRHKLLEILSNKYFNNEAGIDKSNIIGVSFTEIKSILNVSDFDFEKIKIELYNNNEIQNYNFNNITGLRSTKLGLSAFSNKKYTKISKDLFIKNIKDLVQIFIPIIAVLISFYSVFIISTYKSKVKELELRVKKLETYTRKKTNQNLEKDTLFLKK